MNLLPMRYFLTVAEKQSISKAAAELHITQQTLSAHMAALEKELHCCLFQRKPHFALTYAGEVFLRYCRQFGTLTDAMTSEFADITADRSGVLKLGVAHTRGKILLPEVIARLQESYPNLQVQFCEAANDALLAMLLRDEIDVMIGNVPTDVPELVVQPVLTEQLCLCYAPQLLTEQNEKQTVCLNDFATLPFLLCDAQDILGRLGKVLLEEAHIVPKIAATSGNIETLLRLCVQGGGVCFCTDYLAAGVLSEQEAARLVMQPLEKFYTITMAWKQKPYISSVYRQLAALLCDFCLQKADENSTMRA